MDIVILRHGQAEANANADAERKLTARGVQDSLNAGLCLSNLQLEFDELWVSPYLRTQQTAAQVRQFYPDLACQTEQFLTPDIYPEKVFQAIKQANCGRLLIVSHQPLVSTLVALLTQPNSSYGPPMSPATMACVSNEEMLAGCGELKWLRHAPEFNIAGL